MRHLTYILLCSIILAACSSEDHSDQIKAIDQEIEEVQKAHAQFLELDSAEVVDMAGKYNQHVQAFKRFYKPDSINRKISSAMSTFRIMKKVGAYKALRKEYSIEVSFCVNQLTDLKTDIEEGIIPEDSVQHYVQLEIDASKLLRKNIQSYLKLVEDAKICYDTLNPFIENFVDSIQRVYEQP